MNPLPGPDFGYSVRTVRTRWYSGRIGVRLLAVTAVLLAIAAALSFAALGLGDFPLGVGDIATAMLGSGPEFTRMVVLEWRLPVALAALLFGSLLGIGGAIFQSLTRNPLGSPDVIGFDAGAYFGVAMTTLVIGATGYWITAGAALAGGLLTALVVAMLAFRGGITGFRLIIVGIAISAMLTSANSYVITRADLDEAIAVGFWNAGSLGSVTSTSLMLSALIAAGILAAAAATTPSLRRLELGDDAAATLGTRVGRARLVLLVIGVATTALVTAAAGPIAFVALVAPQLARRLTGSPGVSVLASAAAGAALLAAAQVVSMLVEALYRPVPVGLVTVCLGGCYLIWLLVRETRRQHGGMPR